MIVLLDVSSIVIFYNFLNFQSSVNNLSGYEGCFNGNIDSLTRFLLNHWQIQCVYLSMWLSLYNFQSCIDNVRGYEGCFNGCIDSLTTFLFNIDNVSGYEGCFNGCIDSLTTFLLNHWQIL